ncbi:MAG: lamin tail domain-containing protein [Bacteroidales bacterium]
MNNIKLGKPGHFFKSLFWILILYITQDFIAQSQSVIISELMPVNNSTIADADGDYSDWIELFNNSQSEINLAGWALTDDRDLIDKWTFPDIKIKPGDFLLVFASGKNRSIAGEELHSSFKLSGSGEYLALIDLHGQVLTEFSPFYMWQEPDVSIGLISGKYLSLSNPTPGKPNKTSAADPVPQPLTNYNHGFYKTPFELVLSSSSTSQTIIYTTDGSVPALNNGIVYTHPVSISKTTILRAVAMEAGRSSRVTTMTFLFPADIIHQSNNPPGYPSQWGPFTGISGYATADYEMDPELVDDPGLTGSIENAIYSLPVISIVTNRNNLFSPVSDPLSGGIYYYTGAPLTNTTNAAGFGWERPVSIEYFDSKDSVSLQADCALQLHGGHSRRAEKSPKHSFRLEFKDEHGPAVLNFPLFGKERNDEINSIVLRAGFNNSWLHHTQQERVMAQYIYDSWAKDSHASMGNLASKSIFINLFINGIYWGIYSPSERIDSDFLGYYTSEDKNSFDIVKDYTEVSEGNVNAWNEMMTQARAGLSSNTSYQKIQGNREDGTRDMTLKAYVDVVSLADYMILNFFAGNTDWDHHNWLAARNRENPGKGFRFYCWDEEKILEDVNINLLGENNTNCPSYLFQRLRLNSDFKRLFADRIQKFCFGNGALTPVENSLRYETRAKEIEDAIVAESARWGDYRRDVHQWQTAGPFDLYTREKYWDPRRLAILNDYFPKRTEVFITQLRAAGLFPTTVAPVAFLNSKPAVSGIINKGDTLQFSTGAGIVYYTTDGTDPVNWVTNPVLSSQAKNYSGPLYIVKSGVFKARTLFNGTWSAMTELFLTIPGELDDLKITEINYHPRPTENEDAGAYEFLEIKNTGIGTIGLQGMRLTGGISFTFPEQCYLGPGKFIVIAADPDSFYIRYNLVPLGQFKGNLSNNGETIVLLDQAGDTLCNIEYSDRGPWPEAPDGQGNTLVPKDLNPSGDQKDGASWRPSCNSGGSPGRDDVFRADLLPEGREVGIITIYQNYPNPFKENTNLPFRLDTDAQVVIEIYDLSGIKVATFLNSSLVKGDYSIVWKGEDQYGRSLPGGTYIYRIRASNKLGTTSASKMLVILR